MLILYLARVSLQFSFPPLWLVEKLKLQDFIDIFRLAIWLKSKDMKKKEEEDERQSIECIISVAVLSH